MTETNAAADVYSVTTDELYQWYLWIRREENTKLIQK